MKVITLFLVLFASFAPLASAADDSWREVKTTAIYTDISGCIYLERVKATASSVVVTPTANKHVTAQALKRLMILADRAGADSLLVTEIKAENGRAEMRGEAYRCWAE